MRRIEGQKKVENKKRSLNFLFITIFVMCVLAIIGLIIYLFISL